ncbi:ATP-dependent DNA helicase DinG [Heyndrickxia acidiproducens]|uniref:ATP-dependent DNA helicase DinG n=1 Tax=Heyndrickxia acidiproducens TaxID=1121084 RepID=UPI000366D62D|nr:ATP-dependent DNA helicase DinG [Heyndrickxia acidiproducens]
MAQRFIVVDLETTGNAAKKGDRMIQFSAVAIENGEIQDQYTSFVHPGQPVPVFIEELTGIHDRMLADAPVFSEIAPRISRLLEGSIFVAHNVMFDLPFLQHELKTAGFAPFQGLNVDTVEFARIVMPDLDSYKLSDLAESLSLSHDRPHQADSDALVTAKLLLELMRRSSTLPLVTLEKLAALSYSLKSDLGFIFQDILAKKRRHAENLPPDIEVYRGIALRKKTISSGGTDFRKINSYPSGSIEKEKYFSAVFDEYERRPGQFEMMDHVRDAFENSRHTVIEAGTGVGKTLAYLLPSAFTAINGHEPVLISTYTVALEHQLLNKEVKLLEKMMQVPLRTVLLKGRSHYLSLFKFEQSLKEQTGHYEDVLAKMQILVWLTFTSSGDVDELNLTSGGKRYWRRIKQDGWHLGQKDPWMSRDFYLHAKQAAAHADIAVTNHAMLCSELGREPSLFDDFPYVVIDEAHHFEQTARETLGMRAGFNQIKYLISCLGLYEQKQMFYELERLTEKYGIIGKWHTFEINTLLQALDADMDDLFGILAKKVMERKKDTAGYQKIKFRINKAQWKQKAWQAVLLCAERIYATLKDIRRALIGRLELLQEKAAGLTEKEQAFIEELYSFLNDWEYLMEGMLQLMGKDDENRKVVWLEGDLRALPNSLVIQCQPVSVASTLQKELYAKKKCVVMTSATLTVNHSFQYFLNEVGLPKQNVNTVQIRSPFQYDKQVQFIIPNDLPDISSTGQEVFAEKMAAYLLAIAAETKGRMMILFTSFDLLKNVYHLMNESGLLDDFMLIAQGISSGSRSRLTKNFKKFDKAILFGTSSFWEGIDIPGEDLSCLVMARLPFLPPGEPVTEAKCDDLRTQGKNPFSAYSLPEAVLRFKQGFGRLIRRKSDRGIFIVLDRRIETTTYGRAFIRSIPAVQVKHQGLDETLKMIGKWL